MTSHGHHSLHFTLLSVIFVRGFLKAEVFECPPKNLLGLKQVIHTEIQRIPQEIPGVVPESNAVVRWQSQGHPYGIVLKTETTIPVTENDFINKFAVKKNFGFYLHSKLGKLFCRTLHKEVLLAIACNKNKTRLSNSHLQLLLVFRTLRNILFRLIVQQISDIYIPATWERIF